MRRHTPLRIVVPATTKPRRSKFAHVAWKHPQHTVIKRVQPQRMTRAQRAGFAMQNADELARTSAAKIPIAVVVFVCLFVVGLVIQGLLVGRI